MIESPRLPHMPTRPSRAADQANADERAGHLSPSRTAPTFRAVTGYDVDNVRPGDRVYATQRVRELRAALTHKHLTRSERTRLWTYIRRWEARASGLDARYHVVGNRPGQLSADERRLMREYEAHVTAALAVTSARRTVTQAQESPSHASHATRSPLPARGPRR